MKRSPTDEERRGMRAQLAAADARMVKQNKQACCHDHPGGSARRRVLVPVRSATGQ